MSLVIGRGPLSPTRAGWYSAPVPTDLVYVEPHPRRIQAELAGQTVIDTEAALLVHRAHQTLSFAFPADLFTGPGACAAADLPHEPEPAAPGYVAVPWDAVDAWFEEGRRLVHYPPNPYHRVDCRPTNRRLQVSINGTTLVDTTETTILFETALEPRLYVTPQLVRTDLLRRTDTTSYCNYKGIATYWAAEVDGTVVADVAWSYEDPLPESMPIKGFLSFDAALAQVVAELPVVQQQTGLRAEPRR